MKTILLPVEANTVIESTFVVADMLASRLASQVEGVALKSSIIHVLSLDGSAAVVLRPQPTNSEALQAARSLFERYRGACTVRSTGDGNCRVSFNWSGGPGIDDDELASLARVFDITVVGQPSNGWDDPRMATLEAALFETGRPVMMVPSATPKTLGTNVLIHWNASTETVRAIGDALPLLSLAERITLLSIEGNMVPGPDAADMVGYLAAHSIKTTASRVMLAANGRVGETILAEARRIGADLLVKGAYTRTKLRQKFFGGATRHILEAAHIPVILSR